MITTDEETEATILALELLMPVEFLQADLEGDEYSLDDTESLQRLADRYQVDLPVLALRLSQLEQEGLLTAGLSGAPFC